MRITRIDSFHADGGWRPFSFLKISTDEGLVGWSEYALGLWAPALPDVIAAMGQGIIGQDPRAFGRIGAALTAQTRFTPGGLAHQAVAAIQNACVDIAAKAAGVPVCALFGGPFRDRLELYWSHCGSFRARDRHIFEDVLGLPPLTALDDFEALGRDVVARGYAAAKINPIAFAADGPRLLNPGFAPGVDFGRRLDQPTLAAIEAQVEAFASGLGGGALAMLDLNFGFTAGGFAQIARRLAGKPIKWLEIDSHDPASLATVRPNAPLPIASLEAIYGRAGVAPFLQAQAVDVAIVDILWNGIAEGVRMANLAEIHDVNVAPHNFYGPLGDLMSAHFCAAVPNFEIMEIEGDDVPWKSSLLTSPVTIANGVLTLPGGVGWGANIDEAAVAAHPWPRR